MTTQRGVVTVREPETGLGQAVTQGPKHTGFADARLADKDD